ncbi:teashirt homolog 3 [Esox lucius]|uniref:C2H2-type domain-containing protein n=2 Tax=Esox lucius TaxID=8010 RepID=A0AAY5L9I1_ESOLU|nr:teashirt homolog 3 [Esox lucius]
MPRRKQEAPKRAAAYSPEELEEMKEHALEEEVEEEDVDFPEEGEGTEKDLFTTEPLGDQDSVAGTEVSAQEMDSESHVSEASDLLSDFETASFKAEEVPAKEPQRVAGLESPPPGVNAPLAQDTLEQMKAIYSSFLTNSYWSPLNFNPTPAQTLTPTVVEKPPRTSSTSSSSSCSSSYDWHQSAVAKSLQQRASQSRHTPSSEPSLFSTVQLHRQNPRLYGNIFTGASKFRCKGCSAAYDTLVELTVHMNETGHYRDDNHERGANGSKGRWSKPRKRSLLEMEGKEDAQKVLKCMYCGHSFESLQDLSVHMIKTKHYQKVPLKEPMVPVAAKMISRKRAPLSGSLDFPGSPRGREVTPKPKVSLGDPSDHSHKSSNPYSTPNNRFGHQNGASYAWQFESRKSQILKCMECGSSYNTLQELTAHMMVTGHFLRVTNSNPLSRRGGRSVAEAAPPSPVQSTDSTEERVQSIPLAPSTFSPPPAVSPPAMSPPLKDIKKEDTEEECTMDAISRDKQVSNRDGDVEVEEKFDISTRYDYLTEEDLKESPKGGLDILKSLENTVTSAINKAQSGNPSWGGYPSIHAAYQFPSSLKLPQGCTTEKSSPLKYFTGAEGVLSSLSKIQPLISPLGSQSPPFPHLNNFQAMEELVKKVTEKVAKVERRVKSEESPKRAEHLSPCSSEGAESTPSDSPQEWRPVTLANSDRGSHGNRVSPSEAESRRGAVQPPASALNCSAAIITGHAPLEQPFVNPLSALQSVMNVHLGKAAKPIVPSQDPLSLLSRLSQSMAERAAVAATPTHSKKQSEPAAFSSVCQSSNDQPMDLTKGKSDRGGSMGSAPLTPSSTASSVSPVSMMTPANMTVVSPFASSSPLQENALSDISDMLRNLTQSAHVSKPVSRTRITERVVDAVGPTAPEEAEGSMASKRKGRQSNWNPQHLFLLQAQFSSSLRQTSDGKYIMSDLSPQERMHVSRFTGLSMTTISHWLANVKYQLRRTGRTKFLKNLDSGHPLFFCSECASQIRTPTAYICHLEAHLGFRLKDLAKLAPKQTLRDSFKGGSDRPPLLDPFLVSPPPASQSQELGSGTVYHCQLCIRKFASKHAIKLHLSKSHGKSPEDHLLYVSEMEKHSK